MVRRLARIAGDAANGGREMTTNNPENPPVSRNFLGGVYIENSSSADNLAIALCSYFSKHTDRPDDDPEHDDNFHWGDWVIEKTNAALDLIASELAARQKGDKCEGDDKGGAEVPRD